MFLRQSIMALALAWVCGALLDPCTARACSTVSGSVNTFGLDAQVPGNLVFFEVLEEDGLQLELIEVESGRTIPASIRTVGSDRVFAPDAPVAPGLRLALLRRHGPATPSPDAEQPVEVYEFTTGAHVTPQAGSGRLTLLKHSGNQATFLYETPNQDGQLDHLLRLSITVDGKPLGAVSYEMDTAVLAQGPPDPAVLARIKRRRILTVRTSCDGTRAEDSCGGQHTFDESEHELVVTPHMIGLEQQPAALHRTVAVHCDQGCQLGSRRAEGALLLPLYLWLVQRRRRPLAR